MADGSLVEPPQLVGFGKALEFIRSVHRDDQPTLVAIDQPTIVLNTSGIWIGGGVQPANRAKIGMFSDNPPIWRFLQCPHAAENPELAREAKAGLFLMEVKVLRQKAWATLLFVLKIGAPSSRP